MSKQNQPQLILASASPRRREILTQLGLDFKVELPLHFKEEPLHGTDPKVWVLHNATQKAQDVAARFPNNWVLGVDTIGLLDQTVLEKPKDRAEAFETIQSLQGRSHSVLTALALIQPKTGKIETLLDEAKVSFSPLNEQQINDYLDRMEWTDKAAAYAIQGHAALFVSKLEGDHFTVVGLSPACLRQVFLRFDLELLSLLK